LAGALAALALGLAAPARAQSWDEVVAAAKREGSVLLYSNIQPNGVEPLLQKFREDYPEIKTEQIRLGAPPMLERFIAEYGSGRHLVDVMITFPDELLLEAVAQQGWAMKWTPPELGNLAPEYNRDNTLFTLQHAREAIIWNKNLVKDADAPTS
jgi:iron(III) transport system substrate-binding protein